MIPCDEGLAVSSTVETAELRRLLTGLGGEHCTHSWRNFSRANTAADLLHWENELRPTTLFFYYAVGSGARAQEPRLMAAATVADAVHRDFPHAGFPVLARCYVLPEFRAQGLYSRILRHRLRFCSARFGARLKAIHMGTADERIAQRISRPSEHGPRFVRIGSQRVRAGSQVGSVGAYVHLAPSYLSAISRSLHGADPETPVGALQALFARMLAGAPDDHALKLHAQFLAARSSGWSRCEDPEGLAQLLDLCRWIPVDGLG